MSYKNKEGEAKNPSEWKGSLIVFFNLLILEIDYVI